MTQTVPALSLPPEQTRLINALEGLRLEVLSGCLWLTRPGDTVDRFLVAGSHMELHENLVLIQGDKAPGSTKKVASTYRLTPLKRAPVSQNGRRFKGLRFWRLQPSCA